ncbi:MAG TPA: PEP-CTERM sorting domain-containing protein, partial [Phycisphaerae bacterium]|nr:PEP-CTERM sorting domain-containing protein [Phycisphaerae bacterium]
VVGLAGAYAISSEGDIVAGYASTAGGREAFRWTESEGMVGLGHLGDDVLSAAYGMSTDGHLIVGRSSDTTSSTTFEAFRWTAETGMVGLGQLQSDGFGSSAVGVSGDGNIIFGRARRPGVHSEAFRWTADAGMVGIGDIPGGVHWSEMDAVNFDASIMVGVGSDTIGFVAAIWDESSGIRTIASFAESDLGLDLDGWRLSRATGISSDGSRIVGLGVNPSGQEEAWMLVVPEPTTAAFMFLIAAGATIRRRRVRDAAGTHQRRGSSQVG